MKTVLLVLVFVIAGCSSTHQRDTVAYSDTMKIIRAAAEAAPEGVDGLYTLRIVATGVQNHVIYLNTEQDYRDPRAITVALHPNVVPQLTTKYGIPPNQFFINKSIIVKGKSRRVRINFTSQGKPSGKYYYQTHIRVTEIDQIKVIDEFST